jgi:hypothetical protein
MTVAREMRRMRSPTCYFDCITSELKVEVLVLGLTPLSNAMLMADYGILLYNIFGKHDMVGLNNCIFWMSNKTFRSYRDIRFASWHMNRLFSAPKLSECMAIACLKDTQRFFNDELHEFLTQTGIAFEWDRSNTAPATFATTSPLCVAIYAARRGVAQHSTYDLYNGMLVCFDVARCPLSPTCIDMERVAFTMRGGHISRRHTDVLLRSREMGVYACLFTVGPCSAFQHGSVVFKTYKNGIEHNQRCMKVPFGQQHIYDIYTAWD